MRSDPNPSDKSNTDLSFTQQPYLNLALHYTDPTGSGSAAWLSQYKEGCNTKEENEYETNAHLFVLINLGKSYDKKIRIQ